jgi:MFS family permease
VAGHQSRGGLGSSFWIIWVASTISNIGSGLTYVALPLLAASYTHDPRQVAAISVAWALPPVLFGLHSGALVDRKDRRLIMWSSDIVRATAVGGLCAIAIADLGTIWSLAALTFVLASAGIVFENAASAIVPMLVERDRLEHANGWLMSGQTIGGQFVGLPIGGALFAVAAALPFGVDAATYAIAVVLVLSIPGSYRVARDADRPTTVWEDVREGIVWLARHRLLRTLALLLAVVNGTFAAVEAPLVLYVLDELHAGRFGYALLLVVLAVGAIVGALVAGRLRRAVGIANLIAITVTCMVIGLVVPGLVASTVPVMAAVLVAGLGSGVWNVVTVSLRQRIVPDHLLGRVTSAYRVVGFGVMPVGAAAGGFVAHSYGLRAPWLMAAVALVLASVAGLPLLRSADAAAESAADTAAVS